MKPFSVENADFKNLSVNGKEAAIKEETAGWQGDLDVYANYTKGDIVQHSGKTYIASSNINSDPVMGHYPSDPGSLWRELSGGATSSGGWKGDWDVNTNYTPGEIVRYQEKNYIANRNVLGDPTMPAYPSYPGMGWDVLASSGGWQGDLDVYANYTKGDIVQHSGKTYIASDYISSDPVMGHYPTDPGSLWRELSGGGGGSLSDNWKGDWDMNQNYSSGQMVKYQGRVYIATQDINADPVVGAYPTDSGIGWQLMVDKGVDGTGTQGPKGDTGGVGPKGDTGGVGPKGDTGGVGPKGDTGGVGPTGPTGPKGDTGNTGATGPQGPAGPTGPKGNTGNAGASGSQGTPGVSVTISNGTLTINSI